MRLLHLYREKKKAFYRVYLIRACKDRLFSKWMTFIEFDSFLKGKIMEWFINMILFEKGYEEFETKGKLTYLKIILLGMRN